MATPVIVHQEGRKASWFELFFDLVFVTAVAAITGRLVGHYDPAGAAGFAFLLLILWWLWLGQTFHASRFDRDRPDQWATGFAQMIAVIFIAYGSGDAFGTRIWAFATGVAAFKLLLALSYLREMRPGLERLCRLYAVIYGVQAGLFLGSLALGGKAVVLLWAAALALDIASPFIVARETHRAPPHPEHLPERFGLFTIILLGETAAAAIHALDHGDALHADTTAVALIGAGLGFLFWIGYFRRAGGHAERHVRDAASGRALRLWAYGHIPLYLGIGGIGAGTVYLAHHMNAGGAAPWLYAGSVAAGMLGITLVSAARHGASLRRTLPFLGIAGLTGVLPVLTGNTILLGVLCLVLCVGQIVLSTEQRR